MTLIEALNLGFAKVVFSDEPLRGSCAYNKVLLQSAFIRLLLSNHLFIFVEKLTDILFDKSSE